MLNEKRFLEMITYGPFLFIPLFVSILIYFTYQTYNQDFENKLVKLKENILQEEKKNIEPKFCNRNL